MFNENLILRADSYKYSHHLCLPKNTSNMYEYIESRGGDFDHTVFFGLQYYLKEYLSKPISKENIDEAEELITTHGEPFNRQGWEHIFNKYGGYLPIRIKAPPEGTVIPVKNVLTTIEDTGNEYFDNGYSKTAWVPAWIETLLLKTWYPITVATSSYYTKKLIKSYLDKTSDDPDNEILFKLHDFGYRGVSSEESACIGSMAHLLNFRGTDTIAGIVGARKYYSCKMAGYSIPASEHGSTISWGRENEVAAYRNMLKQFGKKGAMFAAVSDSYDLWNAIENLWGDVLRQEVIDSQAIVIIRPDSGHPATVVLRAMEMLAAKFGTVINKKGYKVLNNVRVIQGDGINRQSIDEISKGITDKGFSETNIAFGQGGALLQIVNRDNQRFAMKPSEVTVDGVICEICKSPATDLGKASKKGRLDLVRENNGLIRTVSGENHPNSIMQIVYENGNIPIDQTLDEARLLAI